MEDNESKISNIEWGLVIGALFTIDAFQILIEWLFIWVAGASVIINVIIDVVVGFSLGLYLQLRGQSMANPKRLFALLATFGFEMVPLVSELPLWGLDGIFNMAISKSDKIVAMVPVAEKMVRTGEKVVQFVPKAKRMINRNRQNDEQKAA